MRIYLDVSCLGRPFDNQLHERIRLEAEAITLIFHRIDIGDWQHASSEMALIEILAMPDPDRQRRVRALLPRSHDIMPLSEEIFARSESLIDLGFHAADAVHIAAAEAHDADIMLSCDDKLVRRGRRIHRKIAVEILNPVSWLRTMENAQNT